jgi:hypothetical protein
MPVRGYLHILVQPNITLQKLHEADVIIINEMLLFTNVVLNVVCIRIKQSTNGSNNLFGSKMLLLVGIWRNFHQYVGIVMKMRNPFVKCATFQIHLSQTRGGTFCYRHHFAMQKTQTI